MGNIYILRCNIFLLNRQQQIRFECVRVLPSITNFNIAKVKKTLWISYISSCMWCSWRTFIAWTCQGGNQSTVLNQHNSYTLLLAYFICNIYYRLLNRKLFLSKIFSTIDSFWCRWIQGQMQKRFHVRPHSIFSSNYWMFFNWCVMCECRSAETTPCILLLNDSKIEWLDCPSSGHFY